MLIENEKIKRICVNCEVDGDDNNIYTFMCHIFDSEKKEWINEIYCSKCLTNILIKDPERLASMWVF